MTDILYVRTATQALIFEGELKGQLSDGNWENEKTDRRLWNCEVRVSAGHTGCTFKAKYPVDFNDEDLIEVVGDRMLGYAKKADPDYNYEKLIHELDELTEIVYQHPVIKAS